MIINFIRHSITHYNEAGLASGGLIDTPLSQNGIDLIKRLKDRGVYPEDPGVIYCSKLVRTRQTLEIIYPDVPIIETELLNERVFGEVELIKTREESDRYRREHPQFLGIWEYYDYAPKGGESVNVFLSRVRRGFSSLLDEFKEKGYSTVTIGCHGAYFKALSFIYELDPPNEYGRYYFLDNGKGMTCEVSDSEKGPEFTIKGFIGGDSFDEVGLYFRMGNVFIGKDGNQ